MNTTTWIIQGILATVFFTSGWVILLLPKEKLATKLSWVREFPDWLRTFICSSKIAGALGLILPMYLNILPILTPLAACGIAMIMALAMGYHIRKKEYKDIPATIIFLVLSIFVAANRF